MKKTVKKLFSFLLAAVMLLSLSAPLVDALQVSAAQTSKNGNLRFGVLSDIHISYDYEDEVYGSVKGYFDGVQPTRFEKALRFFKSQGVEAVVIAGDLQEASGTTEQSLDAQKDWLQTVVDIWFKVFPEKPGEDGYVEPIFTYGNHDSALVSIQYWPEELGTYQDVFTKEVNGYTFVCTQNSKEDLVSPLLEKAAARNQDKPIFYIQHCPIAYTVPGDYGYGQGYGINGWKNVAPYHNVVAFTGHTHVPLTDERSIWQGDAGNEGQFTAINTATINYSGLSNDDMSINSYAGNAQQTEHGMIVDVSGSQVSVNRYSMNDMTIDAATGVVSGSAVKIGATWSWDACDVNDRPYAYDNRVANAVAPQFASGAAITVDSVSDTSVTVTIPAATLNVPAGSSDMIESYVVEACNPASGEAEAVGRIATSYHVDDKADVYQSCYTVTVSGLKSGTKYTLKAYAQEFFDKRSEPLTAEITTAGTLASYRRGDVNKDGNVDTTDMTLLQDFVGSQTQYGSSAGDYNALMDIDMNGINEERDLTELQAIISGKKLTYPETGDLMDLVTAVKLTGVSTKTEYQPVDYGTTIQNQVVRGDSRQAVKTWTTNYAYYPKTTMYFDEPVDLSGYTHLSFDTLFENEYNLSDSYRKRWLSVSLISGEQEQVASYGSMNFDANNEGWTTTTIILSNLKNIDLTAVTGIRFEHNFDYYEGRFDGVTEHAIYWDNFRGILVEGTDSDILGSSVVVGGNFVYGAGYTQNTGQAVQSTGGKLDISFSEPLKLDDYAGFYVDIRSSAASNVSVQPLDESGNVIGSAVSVSATNIYKNRYISIAGFNLDSGVVAYGLRFTYSCDELLLDNLTVKGSRDADLIGTAASVSGFGDDITAEIVLEGTNGSNNALSMTASAAGKGGAELTFARAQDWSKTPYLRLDIAITGAVYSGEFSLYNTAGDEIWNSGAVTIDAGEDYASFELDMSAAEDLSDVAKLSVGFDFAADAQVLADNVKVCHPIEDFFSAESGILKPGSVQDGFICEVIPETDDGRTNVMHWFSDPNNGSGTTSAWPGETKVFTVKDLNFVNHSGYSGDYDYLEFTIKNTGNYVAFSFSFLDESGAVLGSSNGEYRVSLEEEWSTYRLDLASAGLTADEVAKISSVAMGWNWQYQNVNGTETKKVADIYIDNMGFCSYPEENTDYLDQIGLIRNSEWWWGGHNSYPDAGWLYQSDVTVDSDNAFMFYRGPESKNMGYSPRILYAYFAEPITVQSDWKISLDVINENFAKNSRLEIVGSDNKVYTCFTFSGTGTYKLDALVSSLQTSDGVAFDPQTVTIKGLKYHTNYNPDSTVKPAENGYLVLDNLTIAAPPVVPEYHLDGLDIIENSTASFSNSAAVDKAFVFETLDSIDGRENVVHMYADPANGGGYVSTGSYYAGAVLTLSDANVYRADGVDFIELNLKNTNIYCDQLYIEVLDSAGTVLGKIYKRMATTNDWSYYRFDLALLTLTEEELNSVACIKVLVNWSKQLTSAAAPVAGEVYIDNLTFGSYVDDSNDLFDHIASVQNVEWWWSGNNTYGGAGWLMEENDDGNYNFKIYRDTVVDSGAGYSPRRQYLYFDSPLTLNENSVFSIDATNSYMGTGSKISFLGDDGNKYGYLLMNQAGPYHYELPVSQMYLLNADTHMTVTETVIDVSAVKIIGVIMHNDFFSGDKTYVGSLVMDNFRLGEKESVVSDWIHMSIDSGMSENVSYQVASDNTFGDSTAAMKVETGEGYRVTFNTQAAVLNGTLPGVVNMANGGIIGGYFYFGDQTPDVKVRLTDKNWNGGATLGMNLIDVGDGWYYAYQDVSQFYFYESATNPTKEEIIRVSVIFPNNYTVYIDQFTFPTYIPAEILDYRIIYDANGSDAVARDLAVRLKNDMEWNVDVVPDTVSAVNNEIVLGDAARENSTAASYLKDGSKQLGEFDYAVVVENGKIYLAATTNAGLYQAMDKLVELSSAGKISDGVYLKDEYDTEDTAELAENADIRLMSYNILYSTEYLVEDRIGNFLNILGYYKPDVIGLQETSAGSNEGWHEYIQDALVADEIYLKACKSSDSVSGLMTTFLYNPNTVKLIDEYVIDLEEGSQIRVLAVAVFERLSDGQRFVVTNTHPAPSGQYAANMTALLAAAKTELAKYSDLPFMMVGDYNTSESAEMYTTIQNELNVVDTKYAADILVREYNTYSGFGTAPIAGSEYCIDHIFANGNVDTKLYNIVIDHDVEHTSDHIPIYVDVKLAAPAQPEKDEDFFYNATINVGVKQSEVTNNSTISWKLTPTATGWSYPTFVLDKAYDISKYDLVMDIYPANMKHFRMHLATLDGNWISGSAVYYGVDKWTTVTYNLSANSAGLTEATKIGLGIDFASDGDWALYIDNVRLVERKVNADATEETEKASDMLSIATYEWSGSDWSGNGVLSYSNQSDETNGKDSLRSWRFSRNESTGAAYVRMQIKMNQIYDMTGKDLVFDIKFDTGREIGSSTFGILLQDSSWANLFLTDNYAEPTIVAKDGEWYTVRLDNSLLNAYLLDGKDLSAVYLMNFCFQFPKDATDIYIDNMHLEDHVYGTAETDAADDLLAGAAVVQNSADDSVYFYEHNCTDVAFGKRSNSSHKFFATAAGNAYHTVKYDLGKSYDLTGKNLVMDVLAMRCSTTFLVQLLDSNNNVIVSNYRGCTNRRWSEVTPALLSNDLDLTDIRYLVIGAYFQPDYTKDDRSFYVDNVRIESIDTHHTALENKNIVFMGDSITAAGGFKGWSGELEEHYFINRYNLGAGGTSYATISGRGQIFSQTANIPNVDVDYFVLNGGVNDIWSAWDLGSVSSVSVESATVDSFDTNTTAGGMEQMFCYLRKNYSNAKIAFVITYNCYDSGFDSVRYRDEFVPLAKAVCEKWNVPYLDLVNNESFNEQFNALAGIHTYDGVHGNDIGYDLAMRQIAPWLLSLNDATEQTEQNSDLLAYAAYEWSGNDWTGAQAYSYDKACTVTNGPDSVRSWKFASTVSGSGWPAIQLKLSPLSTFRLTGKALQFDVKFEASNGTPSKQVGVRLYDDHWASLGNDYIWKSTADADWQTITVSPDELVANLPEGKSLDKVLLVQFIFDFATNKDNVQTVYIDNLRVVDVNNTATEQSEAASDLLYGAKYVSGAFTTSGFGYDQYNTMYLNGADSKYSLRMYAADDKTAWCGARFQLPQTLDLTNKTLKFDVNQYNHVYIGVSLYDSSNQLVTSDSFTIRNTGWQTFEVNLLGGLAEGRTAADLADIKYIHFSSSFEYVKTGRVLLVDNVQVYENEQYNTALEGLNGLYLGDSISEAISYKGWAGELAEHYGVNSYNVSVSGATLADDGIFGQLAKAPAGVDYDFVMLNGGVNDVWRSIALGEVSPAGTTEFDTTTAIGALEHLFSTIKETYPNAEVCYVLNYVCVQAGYPSDAFRNDFAPLARAACEKWGVHCLDLVDNAEFNAEFDATANVHTYDGVHANTEGYVVLTKYIASWLEEIFG